MGVVSGPVWHGNMSNPDVHVNDAGGQIRMYYHGSDTASGGSGPQATRVAIPQDGLHFTALPELLRRPYFRVFRWSDYYYALAMPGVFCRSADGLSPFGEGPTLFTPNMRHTAVKLDGHTVSVFYTNAGDCPERIFLSTLDLTPDWWDWKSSEPSLVLQPELPYEGSDLPRQPAARGLVMKRVCQLRDPGIFQEEGRRHLLYTVAGEHGIAIAELTI
jgi:hypothetical protein